MAKLDHTKLVLFIPPGLKRFKLNLFETIGRDITNLGGKVIRYDFSAIDRLPDDFIPIVGCQPEFRDTYKRWMQRGRQWIYWDRGYLRRVFATWLPRGIEVGIPMGYYRWHTNGQQMREIYDVPEDRWKALKLDHCVKPWNKNGKHIVVATVPDSYFDLWSDRDWTKRTVALLKQHTDREIRVRVKETKVPLGDELKNAHALVAHGSIAAVESVVLGCPVFVEPISAAALVGLTDFTQIEKPVYPERAKWLHSLAYCQFTEPELVDGTLWRLIH